MASDGPGLPGPATLPDPLEPYYLPPPRRKFQHRWLRHWLLLAVTIATTTLVGAAEHYPAFESAFGTRPVSLNAEAWIQGLWYMVAILGILGAHEMGHYVACRYYSVDATLPFFLPFPSLSGTLGAVIKIREPFPTRTALFDIGVAGPIAGFVVLLPLLFVGMHLSNVLPVPSDMQGWTLGEPLLFKLATRLVFGTVPDGYSVNMHPIVFAAWFGMLATAWNLLPFGQLDGGHLTYAVLGDRSRYFSLATVAGAIVMTFISYSWFMMTLMMVAMLVFLGPRHPRVVYEYEPLAPGRRMVFAFAILMFVLCFTPVPIEPMDILR